MGAWPRLWKSKCSSMWSRQMPSGKGGGIHVQEVWGLSGGQSLAEMKSEGIAQWELTNRQGRAWGNPTLPLAASGTILVMSIVCTRATKYHNPQVCRYLQRWHDRIVFSRYLRTNVHEPCVYIDKMRCQSVQWSLLFLIPISPFYLYHNPLGNGFPENR